MASTPSGQLVLRFHPIARTRRIKGETRYLDGQHDNEEEQVQLVNGALRLEKYEHSFFGADGTTTMVDKLDTESRTATCSRREDGDMKVRTSEFDFPADTFGGGSQLLMVMANLREGSHKIDFHAFVCVPGHGSSVSTRRFLSARSDGLSTPGDLYTSICGLIPGPVSISLSCRSCRRQRPGSIPRDNWKYVGGEFNRYFGGPHVFQVLVPPH